MADGIYVGMAAAAARAAQLDSVADNLANSETPGFKAARPAFQAFLPPQGGGKQPDKIFAAAVDTGIDLRPGMAVPTDNPLDVVPEGDSFLGVRSDDGQIAYTRNGRIEVGEEGELMIAGRSVLGRSGEPITIPEGSAPTIEINGDVTADGAVIDRLALFGIQGPLERQGLSFLTAPPGTVAEMVDGTIRVGELELGNAPALEATISMITAQRNFETAMQAIQTYRKLDERATEVGRVR